MVFIVRNHLDAGNLERLFEEALDIVDSSDFDYEAGSARLLGRDISKIAYTSTTNKLIKILGNGEIKKALKIEADAFTKSAAEKIKGAGGETIKRTKTIDEDTQGS